MKGAMRVGDAEYLRLQRDLRMVGRGTVVVCGASSVARNQAAAELAAILDRKLLTIDLSTAASAYIGETEKNLDRLLAKAEASRVVLLLDEADALFGRRTRVADAHDRHAALETNYLRDRLQGLKSLTILGVRDCAHLREGARLRLDALIITG